MKGMDYIMYDTVMESPKDSFLQEDLEEISELMKNVEKNIQMVQIIQKVKRFVIKQNKCVYLLYMVNQLKK